MNRLPRPLLLAPVAASLAFAFAPPGGWVELAGSASEGGLSASAEASIAPSVDLDANGYPVVAYADYSMGIPVCVKRWTGSTWDNMTAGLGVTTSSLVPGPRIRAGSGSTLFVTWATGFFGGPIMLKKYDGSAWVELGGSATGTGISGPDNVGRSPSLVVDAANNPHVAWQGAFSPGKLFYRSWDGTAWVEKAGSGTAGAFDSPAGATSPSLALDAAGRPHIAWADGGLFAGTVKLVKWNGTAWVEIGDSATTGLSSPGKWAYAPSLAIDGAGVPFVGWGEHNGDGAGHLWAEFLVKRWTGAAWAEVAPELEKVGEVDGQHIGVGPVLAFHPGGRLVAAWAGLADGETENHDIFARTWSPGGIAWEELDASATDHGISSTATNSVSPAIAAGGASGGIAVVWSETSGEQSEIFLKSNAIPVTVAVTSLRQLRTSTQEPIVLNVPIPEGSSVTLAGRVFGIGQPAILDVELRPFGAPLVGTATHSSTAVASGLEASVIVPGLAVGRYHWQARSRRPSDNTASEWLPFAGIGHSAEATFEIGIPSGPQAEAGAGSGGGGKKCAAGGSRGTGLALFAVLSIAYARRRSKRSTTFS